MKIRSQLTTWLKDLRRGRREIWSKGERTHVKVLAVADEARERYAERLRAEVEALPSVRWARLNGALGRLIVSHTRGELDQAMLIERIETVERELGAGPELFAPCRAYPGDRAPIVRNWFEVAADVASFSISSARRLAQEERSAFDIDYAALVVMLEGIPHVKRFLRKHADRDLADLAIELAKSSSQMVSMSETGPMLSALRHGLRLVEARARERLWNERESELCSDPSLQPLSSPPVRSRPSPLRRGIVERYDDSAVPAALGAFATSVWFTKRVEDGSPALFAGLPRTPHQSRSAYASWLGWLLARRGVLVLEGDALRRLDRIDVLVLPGRWVARDEAAAQALARRAQELELRVVAVGKGVDAYDWLPEDGRISKGKLSKAVRRLQQDGSGVALVAAEPCKAFGQADLSLALSTRLPPFNAHVVANHGVHDALWLLDAIAAAKTSARQASALAALEAATGAVLSLAGLERATADRSMSLANLAGVIALLNAARIAHGSDRKPPPPPSTAPPHHAMDVEEVLAAVGSSAAGLSAEEAASRQAPAPEQPTRLRRFSHSLWEELKNPMTPLLVLGAGLSASVGSAVDAGLIAGAVGVNSFIGGVQRQRGEKAISDLEQKEERSLRVLRAGETIAVAPSELVVGDLLELEPGAIVPADCRIVEALGLEVDEAALTGESLPVAKDAAPSDAAVVAERSSMIYAETSIAAGTVRAVVVAVGDDTEAGRARLAASQRTRAGGVEERLRSLASLTMPVAGVSALALLGSGLIRGRPYEEGIGSAVGLGVAAVPEGLPLLATLAQLAAARRLSARGVLVRNPRALEPLGRVDVLCADKTGTLTEGDIRLELVSDGKRAQRLDALDAELEAILTVALRATPQPNGAPLAHATDEALVRGLEDRRVSDDFERSLELPFEPGRGYHATLGAADGARLLAVKGAPEVVLARCTRWRHKGKLRKASRRTLDKLLREARALGRRGYRVLAVAEATGRGNGALQDRHVRELTFRGFVGLADPVRGRSRAAVSDLRAAGVRTVMITGDHPSTAKAIAEEVGFDRGGVLTGDEVAALGDEELAERLEGISVIARVTPAQKVRLVRLLRRGGHTVAMTGDGANDAAAIELSDVGIALGEKSTASARNAADLIVTDGRIETIVEAVLEGRSLWASVRDAVSILVGGNLGEIAFTVAAGMITGISPLNARQLLLVNLVTDTLPALAIAVQPPREERSETLIAEGPDASLGEQLDAAMVRRAMVTAAAAGGGYLAACLTGCGPAKASTVGLVTLTGAQLGQTVVLGGHDRKVIGASAASLAALLLVVELPGISHFFGCRPLGPIALSEAGLACLGATAVAALLERRQPPTSSADAPAATREAEPSPPKPSRRAPRATAAA